MTHFKNFILNKQFLSSLKIFCNFIMEQAPIFHRLQTIVTLIILILFNSIMVHFTINNVANNLYWWNYLCQNQKFGSQTGIYHTAFTSGLCNKMLIYRYIKQFNDGKKKDRKAITSMEKFLEKNFFKRNVSGSIHSFKKLCSMC